MFFTSRAQTSMAVPPKINIRAIYDQYMAYFVRFSDSRISDSREPFIIMKNLQKWRKIFFGLKCSKLFEIDNFFILTILNA